MPASATITRRKARPKAAATKSRSAGRSGIGAEDTAARASADGASRPTSLKLPAALKARIDDIASKEGLSAHAFMLNTLAAATERAYLREQFQHDAQEALNEMKATGMGHALGDVRQYFTKLADFRNGKGPKPRRPVLTKTAKHLGYKRESELLHYAARKLANEVLPTYEPDDSSLTARQMAMIRKAAGPVSGGKVISSLF